MLPPYYDKVAQIEQMRIELPHTERQLLLSDIATIQIQDYPSKSKRRINGNPALTIDVIKEGALMPLALRKISFKE